MSPTARTLQRLRRLGFTADVCERFIAAAGIRKDLFGIADVLAIHPRERLFLLVQATTAAHVAHRLAKARARPELRAWLAAGGSFEVWGWVKRGQRWRVKRVGVRPEDLAATVLEAPRRRRPQRHQQRDLWAVLEGQDAAEAG